MMLIQVLGKYMTIRYLDPQGKGDYIGSRLAIDMGTSQN